MRCVRRYARTVSRFTRARRAISVRFPSVASYSAVKKTRSCSCLESALIGWPLDLRVLYETLSLQRATISCSACG